MQRITISIEDDLLDELDAFMARSGATNRSEALRDLLRRGLARKASGNAQCVGVLSYTVDLSMRDLGRRVPQSRHEHHHMAVAALSVPLDHTVAVEVAVMRGPVETVENYANGLFAERGVRHGALSLVPISEEEEVHQHGDGSSHSHMHLKVRDSF